MHTAEEIRTIEFQKSMSGYKTADVEVFLDEVADQVDSLVKENADLKNKVSELTARTEEDKKEKDSLQNVLLSAQVLADKIVSDAKIKAEELIKKANDEVEKIKAHGAEVKEKLENDHAERKEKMKIDLSNMQAQAVKKTESMLSAAQDSVNREQLLFDKLKVNVATMKKELVRIYKQQLEYVTTMPDEVPFDAEHAAAAITVELEKSPDYAKMVRDGFKADKENAEKIEEEKSSQNEKTEKTSDKAAQASQNKETKKGVLNFGKEKK